MPVLHSRRVSCILQLVLFRDKATVTTMQYISTTKGKGFQGELSTYYALGTQLFVLITKYISRNRNMVNSLGIQFILEFN